MAPLGRALSRFAGPVSRPLVWGAVVAIGGPSLLLVSLVVFNLPGLDPSIWWKAVSGPLVWLVPGMAAVAGAESDPVVRRRIAAATAVGTMIAITIYGLMITTHVACQPVSRVEALPTVLTVAMPAGLIMWALMRIGGAVTVRFGWVGVVAALLFGATATTGVIFWWAFVGFFTCPPGY